MKVLFKVLLLSMAVILISGCGAKPGVKTYYHLDKSSMFRQAGFEPTAELAEEYVLGPADVIEVKVWGYEDLQQIITIPPNGVATFFPVGKIKISGLTASQIEESLKEQLKAYVKEIPSVTVVVKEYNYYRIYVLGEVNKPGLYPYPGKLTVLEAISMAGTYTNRADITKVRVVRIDKEDTTVARVSTINLKSIIIKGDVGQNVVLRPADIVFVPSSVMANVNDTLNQILPTVSTIYYVDGLMSDE